MKIKMLEWKEVQHLITIGHFTQLSGKLLLDAAKAKSIWYKESHNDSNLLLQE